MLHEWHLDFLFLLLCLLDGFNVFCSRCVWPPSQTSIEQSVPGNPLSYEVVKELRALSGRVAPSLRPSIEKVIQRERVECVLVSAILKQLELLLQVGEGKNDSLLPVGSYLFTKMDALIRQIAVCP